ncbi:MAG: SpoIIE family protein phosphatase [Erysipelotrichaceae bacterium]|nr:SpoIIE family protein phosphatase [Erysipelotrichaceae bacterium]
MAKDGFFKRVRNSVRENDVFWHNEVEANKLVTTIMVLCAFLLVVGWILMILDVFPIDPSDMNLVVWQGLIELSIPLYLSFHYKQKKWWLKYLLLFGLTIAFARVDMLLTYKVSLLMTVPVIMSSRYFSKNLTITTAVVTIVLFLISTILGTTVGLVDINIVSFPKGTLIEVISRFLGPSIKATGLYTSEMLIRNTLLYSFLPKLLIYLLVAVISVNIAERGREMVQEQDESTKKSARIDSELTLANDIQNSMLPTTFPAFPDHEEFDLYALNIPAKQVGGDFYDFFMIDRNHLAFIIADVSGKSIPAALFMVIAKTLLKNHTMNYRKPSEVFKDVNNLLCESNDTGLFVTAWMGILNCRTGKVKYVNAGHNPPVLVHNGIPETIKCKSNFILGGMPDVQYPDEEFTLHKGDFLYLYTDGVTEAEDEYRNLYGMDKTLELIKQNSEYSMKELCIHIKEALDIYQRNTEQFDDITMLGLRFTGMKPQTSEIVVDSSIDNISKITAFVNEKLESYNTLARTRMQFDVAIDEICSNIIKHGYQNGEGKISVTVINDGTSTSLVFKDSAIPFNPVEAVDPDVTLSAEERGIGGLGIYMVKKSMDDMRYEYKDGQNILTITKNN